MAPVFPGVRLLAAGPHPELARAWSWDLGSGRAVVVEDAARLVERTVRGQSPERLIWERRLERISEDLRNPAHARRRLIDIALTWGFNSQAHFSRAFRRKYGQSPSAFRRDSERE